MDGFDKHLQYLIDCKESERQRSLKTDSIRSQIFQLNGLRDQFTSQSAFDLKRHQLLSQLGEELDSSAGKNTYLSERLSEIVFKDRSDWPLAEYQSHLYSLSKTELLEKLDITPKMDDSDDCQVLQVVIKKPTVKAKRKRKNGLKDEMDSNGKTKKFSILDNIPSFKSGFPQPSVSGPAIGQTSNPLTSPPKVSGIFRPIMPKVTEIRSKDETKTVRKNISFISGYEKKVLEDFDTGTVDMTAARRALQQFKPPLKDAVNGQNKDSSEENIDPHLKGIDKNLIETIENEIITRLEPIGRQDVAGLKYAKSKICEIAILPLKKPHLFTGIRKPPKGILLFGPPGTGKTFLGRWIASETQSTFFEITVSTLNSKWVGEGEKTIRAMFAVARARQPSVIFIDEIDSLLKSRCDSEHESSRRMKTEFFTQFEGVSTAMEEKLLIIGATNRPQDLDDAARRRLTARLYIGLPDQSARDQLIRNCLRPENGVTHSLTDEQIQSLAQMTDGYSGADMKLLCSEAAMEGIREKFNNTLEDNGDDDHIRSVTYEDFLRQLVVVKPSVCPEDLQQFEEWDRKFGTNRQQTEADK